MCSPLIAELISVVHHDQCRLCDGFCMSKNPVPWDESVVMDRTWISWKRHITCFFYTNCFVPKLSAYEH